MTFKEKREKQEVLYNINLSKQLRKLNKEEKIIERHLRGNIGILSMCARYWDNCRKDRESQMAAFATK